MKKLGSKFILVLFALAVLMACESEKKYPPKGYLPVTPKATDKLEAAYFWTPQDKLSSSYWKNASYVEASLSDISKLKLYFDGYLNMTGTYHGMSGFNRGKDPKVKLRAGYDTEYLYIMVEWKDTTCNASYMTWLWQGPEDIYKQDTAIDWTSQRNNDNVVLLFNHENTSLKDAWKWSMAYTAPFDMALNLKADESGITDEVKPLYRNSSNESPRSGPLYEWNGERQEVLLPDGTTKILDPAYYLLDENKQLYAGNVSQGEGIFNNTADCKYCHGYNGDGNAESFNDGGVLADVFTNKYSRQGLIDFISSSGHQGSGGQYFGRIKNDSVKVENLLSFLRGIAGVPGNVLVKPEGVPEINAISNISVGGIQKKNEVYKVLFKRKLVTENTNDVDFIPGNTYTISIQFSDNDEINYVGATGIELTFNTNEL
jgi:hypothetical protein